MLLAGKRGPFSHHFSLGGIGSELADHFLFLLDKGFGNVCFLLSSSNLSTNLLLVVSHGSFNNPIMVGF